MLCLLLLGWVSLPCLAIEPAAENQVPGTQAEQTRSDSDGIGQLFRSLSSGIQALTQSNESELLPAEQAFHFYAEAENAQTAALNWQIAPGYYLYRDKVTVELLGPTNARLGALQMPPGEPKTDPTFGRTEVYHDSLVVLVPITGLTPGQRQIQLKVGFQGCAEIGVCYPPMSQSVQLLLPEHGVTGVQPATSGAMSVRVSESDRLAQSISKDSLALTALSFFGFGLLLAFTPCVFPMIPILSGIIVGHGHQITTGKACALSSVYVLASALTYTVFGILAGLFGGNLQSTFQQPWIIASFSALFVLLALSMFGHIQFKLPDVLRSRLAKINQAQTGGTWVGVAGMGVLSTLIVGPCVAPPLAGALIYIGQTGDALLGGLALFALGLGMGAPLILIGTSAGKLLPKAGAWMESVKAVFGVLLLAVAIWLLDRIVPSAVTLLLSAALLIGCAMFMRAMESLPERSSIGKRLLKAAGLMFLAYGLVLILGAAVGGGNVLQPLRGLSIGSQYRPAALGLEFKAITSRAELRSELEQARRNGQVTMLDFYADWCVSCKEMEAFTFTDPRVQAAAGDVLRLQIDVTENNAEHQAMLKQFGLIGPPAILFFPPGQVESRADRVIGYQPADQFERHVMAVKQCAKTISC